MKVTASWWTQDQIVPGDLVVFRRRSKRQFLWNTAADASNANSRYEDVPRDATMLVVAVVRLRSCGNLEAFVLTDCGAFGWKSFGELEKVRCGT